MVKLPFSTTLLTPMAPFPQPGTQSDNDAAHDNDGDHYADDPTDYRRLGEGLHDLTLLFRAHGGKLARLRQWSKQPLAS